MQIQKQKRVCAIHDISCVGRCSLTVALPIISAAGFDCGVVPTAVLSTHTGGFEGFTYRDLTSDIQPISAHWQGLGLQFDAMYSGFLGSFDQIDLVGQLFDDFKRGGDTLVLVDPVMADNGKLYSIYSPEMAAGMARLCGKADIIVPNITEACFMVNEDYKEAYDKNYIESLLKKLAGLGPKKVVLTGVSFDEGLIGAAAYDAEADKTEYAFAPRIEGYFHGTGDVFGSALLSALLKGKGLLEAAQIACDFVHKSISITLDLKQEARFGVAFEMALPFLMEKLGIR